MVQVAAAAAAVIILVGIVSGIASRRIAELQAVHDAAQITDLLADSVVQPALTDKMVTADPAALAPFDAVVRQHVINGALVRVKLWRTDGTIVYSDESRVVGMRFDFGPEEREALTTPQTRAEISDLSKPENQFETTQHKLLEVYRPVWTPSHEPLLFETYFRYDTVSSRTNELWRGFSGIMISSLAAILVLLMPLLWTLVDRARRAQAQRESLILRAVDASQEERRRIAGTLHDGVVQELVAVSLSMSRGAEQATQLGGTDLASRLRGSAAAVRGSIGGLRSLLVDIYPPNLRSAGLCAGLADLAGTLTGRGLDVVLDLDPDAAERLDEDGAEAAFRVAQECLRNVDHHAGAAEVVVSLSFAFGPRGDVVRLEVRDDGAGFELAPRLESPAEGHFGLRLMTDAADRVGAELLVATSVGRGTCWRLDIPAR